MHIRPATFADLSALCALDTFAAQEPERGAAIASWVGDGACQLAEIDGEIAGYGVLTRHFFGHAFIEMLMIGSDFRRRGVGSALVAHFQTTTGGSKLFSSTNMSNRSMQNLLLKAGFRPSGYIDNLDENDPELVFFYSGP